MNLVINSLISVDEYTSEFLEMNEVCSILKCHEMQNLVNLVEKKLIILILFWIAVSLILSNSPKKFNKEQLYV